ncbi:hypothetical protein JTB14_016722 [Gonioctena quinquepunctata]|nr:hypothetical protein JTB14_016722 [Gonioctena quinquepunctata]
MEELRTLPDIAGGHFLSGFPMNNIKPEPKGSPSPFGGSVSPYGGSVNSYGGGASPIYAPNILVSPQGQMVWDSPSPLSSIPPPTNTNHWNIPSTAGKHPHERA